MVFIIEVFRIFIDNYGIPIIAALGIGVSAVTIFILLYKVQKEKKDVFRVNVDINSVLSVQRDAITKWATETERKMKTINTRFRVKKFIYIKIIITIFSFIWSIYYFKNLAATLMFTLSMFLIPDYVIHIIESINKKKVEDQLVIAMRIFMQEYMQHYQFTKAFAAIYNKVQKPLGNYFGDAYYELLARVPTDSVLATLSSKIDNYYGKMFIHLMYQIKDDSSVLRLLPDLLVKLEESIEMGRSNTSSLAGERVLSFAMAVSPLPIYLFMRNIVPEIEYFVVNTMLGRLLITAVFMSLFLYIILDRALGRVE